MPIHRPIARFLQLAASALAALGLLGHGFAMLLAGLLLASPAGAVAEVGAGVEICRSNAATGLLAAPELPQDSQSTPGREGHSKIDICPVCKVFAQAGLGALPTANLLPEAPPAAEPHLLQAGFTLQQARHDTRCRAPPQQL